jgi:LPXTG-site transpeptidase (sortase) family protein
MAVSAAPRPPLRTSQK